jgi:hypothetical protein
VEEYTGWYLYDLEVNPNPAIVGQDVEVSAWIMAPGMVLTDITAILSVNEERESTKTLYVEGDSSDHISFVFNPKVTGEHIISFGAILTRDLDFYIIGERDLSTTIFVN